MTKVATQKLNAATTLEYYISDSLYLFLQNRNGFHKKKKNAQSFNIRRLDFDFPASFLKYWINWLVLLLKLNVFRKCYQNFGKIFRDLLQVMKYVNGKCFLNYSGRCVICLWRVSFWEIYAFPFRSIVCYIHYVTQHNSP